MNTISIITISYNFEQFARDYFSSIFNSSIKPSEILFYDGGSSDNTIEIIKKYQKIHPEIKLFQGANVGFAAGNNLLAKKAKGRYLFMLNPDTKLDKDCLKILLERKADDAILVPKQLSFEDKLLTFGSGMDVFGCPTQGKFFADGAAIFVSKKIFKKVGGFDKDYFLFQEDVDFSWRARLLNVPLYFVEKAIVYHFSGGSAIGGSLKGQKIITSTLRRYFGERNVYQNILKNYSIWTLIFVLPANIITNILEMVLFVLTFQLKLAYCYPRAWGWIIWNLARILKKRRKIQKTRKISDFKIFRKLYIGSGKLKLLFFSGIPKESVK